jgi:isoprenylcysteine carboxyl methyltransferase (ICMT) family protein YpbQ
MVFMEHNLIVAFVECTHAACIRSLELVLWTPNQLGTIWNCKLLTCDEHINKQCVHI